MWWGWWLMLGGASILATVWAVRRLRRISRDFEKATAPVKLWRKPLPGADLEFEAVKFIDATWRCPFCHHVLEPSTGAHGMVQNYYCTNAACNSRFLILPMPPAGQMEVQYVGPLPDDVLIHYHMLGEGRRQG
jgi:hypothetical protein